MQRTCHVTGAAPGVGHHVSHSHRRSKPRFDGNNRHGIDTVVAQIMARGGKV